MTVTMPSIGNQIKEARLAKGLSQSAIEKDLGWGRGNLFNYESGRSKIPEDKKDILFDYLGLGEGKVAEFFKETKPAKPIEDNSPDKFGPKKNAEGYSDPTMAEAIKNAMVKYTDHMPGEIWLHKRKNGQIISKLILSVQRNKAICISVFANGSQLDQKVKTQSGTTKYVALDYIEAVPLKELEERTDIVQEKYMDNLHTRLIDILGIKPIEKVVEVEKEVTVEVPVEKIVEVEKEVRVEVPVEKIVEVEKEVTDPVIEAEARIYKEAFGKVCDALSGVVGGKN